MSRSSTRIPPVKRAASERGSLTSTVGFTIKRLRLNSVRLAVFGAMRSNSNATLLLALQLLLEGLRLWRQTH